MLRNRVLKLVCLLVAIVGASANAGSYDDFFAALRNDNADAVTDLLRRGFDPNTVDPKGQPGLTVALQGNARNVARVLLAHPSIDINAANPAGETALMMAALKGDLAGAQGLLEHGARVNQPGWSPIHYAATGPQPQLVRLLLERGADIDAASPNGTTPLMMAAQYGSEDSVSLLLERGADPKRRNERGLGVVEFARLGGREALARRLEQLPR
jgi:uncharacterized protein